MARRPLYVLRLFSLWKRAQQVCLRLASEKQILLSNERRLRVSSSVAGCSQRLRSAEFNVTRNNQVSPGFLVIHRAVHQILSFCRPVGGALGETFEGVSVFRTPIRNVLPVNPVSVDCFRCFLPHLLDKPSSISMQNFIENQAGGSMRDFKPTSAKFGIRAQWTKFWNAVKCERADEDCSR